jgi:hypothetical protein
VIGLQSLLLNYLLIINSAAPLSPVTHEWWTTRIEKSLDDMIEICNYQGRSEPLTPDIPLAAALTLLGSSRFRKAHKLPLACFMSERLASNQPMTAMGQWLAGKSKILHAIVYQPFISGVMHDVE